MSTDPRRTRGEIGEQIAAEHLRHRGYRIVARNYRTRYGELDLVAADDRALVFCEVKTRVAGGRSGPAGALDAIGPGKRRQVRALATQWLANKTHPPPPPAVPLGGVGGAPPAGGALLPVDDPPGGFWWGGR